MTWLRRALPIVALLGFVHVTPAHAQVTGRPFEISGGAGILNYDLRALVKDGPAYHGALGWRAQSWLTIEGSALFGPSESDVVPDRDQNFSLYSLDLRWNVRAAEERFVPYVITGMGYGLSHTAAEPEKLEAGAPSIGLGVLVNALNPRTYVRAQVRDVFFRERNQDSYSQHFAVTVGLQYVFGGKYRDQDLDGVRDWLDTCPATPIGASVDAQGCPTDSDADSVYDGIDQCPNTPRGCRVDRTGCPTDADRDSVCDGLDQCPDTPAGASVDARGCPNDLDNDGVPSGLDRCEGTLAGCRVDSLGCPTDADNDGVCDGLDKCPSTSPGLRVDSNGCPIEVIERETELMDTGMIRMQNVNFQSAKWDIPPESVPALDVVGEVLMRWPELKIEIGGHTDSRGTNAYNNQLSLKRMNAVLQYLLGKFPTLNKAQFTAKGYGESKPIASNKTAQGMAQNRRVEFVVQNRDVLRREVERRRLLRTGEPAPADTTR